MTTKVIFNIDNKLKAAAMKKAHKQGLTLSAVLNIATQAYVDDAMKVDFSLARDIAIAREQVRRGEVIPLREVRKKLGL